MEKLEDELDNHETHIRRLARRIDAIKPVGGDTELRASRHLHAALEETHAAWGNDPPPRWPGPTALALARVGAQSEAIEHLAQQLDDIDASQGGLRDETHRDLEHGRQRMPFALDGQFYEEPMVVPPATLERDFFELLFNAQQEALLKIDNALDQLETPT